MTLHMTPAIRTTGRIALLATLLVFGQSLSAAETATPVIKGSAEAGATKAITCTACHGPNGNSANPEWPRLAGQNAAYLREQIHAIQANKRPVLVMAGLVTALTPQDIADISAYFAAQTPVGLEADPALWQAGAKLYRNGDLGRGIPACMACHGPVGKGNPAAGYPALRAQHGVYTTKQLSDYASDARYGKDDKGHTLGTANATIMNTIASRLTAQDRSNLSAYLQGMR